MSVRMASARKELRSRRDMTAHGYHLYEVEGFHPRFILKAAEILQERFGCGPISKIVKGFDEVITDCKKGDVRLDLGWDIWTGFSIFANSPEGNALVDAFGDYVDSILNEPEIQAYRNDSLFPQFDPLGDVRW